MYKMRKQNYDEEIMKKMCNMATNKSHKLNGTW